METWPLVQVFRGSVSRPWQLEKTTPTLFENIDYENIEYHLVESVFVKQLSDECIEYAKNNGFSGIHMIDPQQGYGFAIKWFLDNIVTAPYMINWEDDYKAEVRIPIQTCVWLMEKYPHINQICFNKRSTMDAKWARPGGGKPDFQWKKKQRYFSGVPLVVKEKWWFGPAIWRVSYIKPKFVGYASRVHHLMNDEVLLPLAGSRLTPEGRIVPTPEQVEEAIGSYIYGKHEDPRMVAHMQDGDSIWNRSLLKKWEQEGIKIRNKDEKCRCVSYIS